VQLSPTDCAGRLHQQLHRVNIVLSPIHTSNNAEATFNFVEATFDFVEKIVRPVAFDNVASTLLLVWTELKSTIK